MNLSIEQTPVGIPFIEKADGHFILQPQRGEHSTEEVNQSKRWLRIEHNVESIKIEWDN